VSYIFPRPTASPTTNELPFLSPLYLFRASSLAETLTHASPSSPSAPVGPSCLHLIFGTKTRYLT